MTNQRPHDNCGKRLEGRHVLITGAASGIGLATAHLLRLQGARLALLDREKVPLRKLGEELDAFVAEVELQDEAAVCRAVADSAAALGQIDGIVNVAGIGGAGPLGEASLADWNRVLAVNLTAPFLVCREALKHLRSAERGTIVNVASGQALLPSTIGLSAYCASKGGLVTLTKALALELAPRIRVNAVCPGVVDTPLIPRSMLESAKAADSPYAQKRIGEPQEIADAILFLTSDESTFITGAALAVDGGRTYH
jgi:NAD(P)-dependent dehydrogenase (short-subunit alcohol dehydrogenase family)